MSIQISISNAIGSRYRGSVVPPIDPDAQAFITAASITDPTQQSAINQLVVDLKGYGIWTKKKALYPFVGGTSSTHKFNLKDPRDLDAAFRLVFSGGWTHSSTGATPNGTNGYANTFVNTLNNLGANSAHLAYYSRTNSAVGNEIPMGNLNASSGASGLNLVIRRTSDVNSFRATDASTNGIVSSTVTDSRGLFIGSITSTTSRKTYKNSSVLNTLTTNYTWDRANYNLYLAAANDILTTNAVAYTNKECAFASIGDGLTDAEAANLYTAVQAFQTTLGRSIGTQTVSDADAQAFVTAANIVDQVEANAINNLVIGMKADGTWTKMKAIYPFVGGTATTNKFNLKDPRDLDAAFRLVFSGGWTHSSTGALPNGTNGYADSKFVPSTHLGVNSNSLGYYSGTNLSETSSDPTNMGAFISVTQAMTLVKSNTSLAGRLNGSGISYLTTTMRGLFSGSRQSSTLTDIYLNGSQVATGNSGGTLPNNNVLLGTISLDPSSNPYGAGFVKNDFRFAYLADGLNDTEISNLYTRVQTFQTALNRNV